eukprot:g8549.t1
MSYAHHRPVYYYASDFPRFVGYDRGDVYHPKNYNGEDDDEGHEETSDEGSPASEHAAAAEAALQDPILATREKRDRIKRHVRNISSELSEPLLHLDWKQLFEQHPELQQFANPGLEKTFGYYEAYYPLLNDAGLTMGESTCSGFIVKNAKKANLQVNVLMQLAMERCATARCAVRLMGRLGELYGFLSEDPGMDGSSEAVTVGDGEEAWVFHITPDGESGAVWVAQRVPDGHVAPIANHFIIRRVDCADEQNFYCGQTLFSTAESRGLLKKNLSAGAWSTKTSSTPTQSQVLDDFTKTYAPDTRDLLLYGTTALPYYITQRVYRVYQLLSPSQNLTLTDDSSSYPFSAPVDRGVTRQMIQQIHADKYEGDPVLDQRIGAMAGAFGNPNRLEGGTGLAYLGVQVPRAISIQRTVYGQVGESVANKSLRSILWLALDQPASSPYLPFVQISVENGPQRQRDAVRRDPLGTALKIGNRYEINRESTWWAVNVVANQMQLYYRLMNEDVAARKAAWEQKFHRELVELCSSNEQETDNYGCLAGDNDLSGKIAAWQRTLHRSLAEDYFALSDELSAKYLDGTVNGVDKLGKTFGFPAFWLQMTGQGNNPGAGPLWVAPDHGKPPSAWEEYGAGNPPAEKKWGKEKYTGGVLDKSAEGTVVVVLEKEEDRDAGVEGAVLLAEKAAPEADQLVAKNQNPVACECFLDVSRAKKLELEFFDSHFALLIKNRCFTQGGAPLTTQN